MPSANKAANVVEVTTDQEKARQLWGQLCIQDICLAERALWRVVCEILLGGVGAMVVGGWVVSL